MVRNAIWLKCILRGIESRHHWWEVDLNDATWCNCYRITNWWNIRLRIEIREWVDRYVIIDVLLGFFLSDIRLDSKKAANLARTIGEESIYLHTFWNGSNYQMLKSWSQWWTVLAPLDVIQTPSNNLCYSITPEAKNGYLPFYYALGLRNVFDLT